MKEQIKRLFVEKKPEFAIEQRELLADLRENLGLTGIKDVRILNRYDVLGLTAEEFEEASRLVFSEPPVDFVFYEDIMLLGGEQAFVTELLPGQYDQREEFAEQSV